MHMKRTLSLLLLIYFILNKCIYAQSYYTDSINFDSGAVANVIIDTTQANNLWHIGMPYKTIFNYAYSEWNAIVTDTSNPYPANNISSFIIKEPYVGLGQISFMHYYYTDGHHAGGYVETSDDYGQTWNNILT